MKREVQSVKVVTDFPKQSFVALLVKVIANNQTFIEYYIGVPKSHPLFSIENQLCDTDPRYKEMNTAFKGCKKEFDSYLQMANMNPIDGAWLSLASIGTIYDFLDDDLFYYGGGMYINPTNPKQSEDNCRRDAVIMIERMLKVADNAKNKIGLKVIETSTDLVKLFCLENIKVPFYRLIKTIDRAGIDTDLDEDLVLFTIEKVESIKDNTISVYDRATDKNGKIYMLNGTDYLIYSNLTIFKKPQSSDEYWYSPKTFDSYKEALIYKSSVSSLNNEEIEYLKKHLD